MTTTLVPPQTQERAIQPEQDRINELTVTPQDVWAGFGDGTGRGGFTPTGYRLRKQNPALAELLARQSMHDHSKTMPDLYPQHAGDRPAEHPELRRPSPAPGSAPKRLSLRDEDLPKHFGPTSDGGKANALAKANPPLYAGSKERAIELGLLAPIRSTVRRKV